MVIEDVFSGRRGKIVFQQRFTKFNCPVFPGAAADGAGGHCLCHVSGLGGHRRDFLAAVPAGQVEKLSGDLRTSIQVPV